jgi:hypothetical protein
MKRRWRAMFALAAGLTSLLTTSCRSKPTWYESEVELVRFDVVRRDAEGKPVTADAEISYESCPGYQHEVMRGPTEFATCMQKHKVGEKLTAKIFWYYGEHGYYEWAVHQLGDCKRPPDADDEASFSIVRDCEDWKVHGASVGFRCKYLGKEKLNAACPWFRRR